jgi:hypothetical protein
VIDVVPSCKPLRWRRDDVPQHVAPETSDPLRFCAVEGDLELLDRRHWFTIETPQLGRACGRRDLYVRHVHVWGAMLEASTTIGRPMPAGSAAGGAWTGPTWSLVSSPPLDMKNAIDLRVRSMLTPVA